MFSFLFIRLFGYLCLPIGHCVKCPCDGDDVKCPYVWDDLSISAGTLICIKSLATIFESVVPLYLNDSQ
jgi:hypothetical protein